MTLSCNLSVSLADLNTKCSEEEKNLLWYVTTVLLILIIILAILGNLMVLTATWVERNLYQPTKYFIACLAIADLLVGLISCPLLLYQHLNTGRINSIHLCRFYFWIDYVVETASIYTLTFISFDRYLKIKKPFRYSSLMTTSKSFIAICAIWLISIIWGTFGMFSYSESGGIHIHPNNGCTNDNIVFYTASAVFAFFAPTITTLVMYLRILSVAHKRRKMAQNGGLGEATEVRNQRNTLYQDLKNVCVLAIVMGTFIICWGCFFTLMMIRFYFSGLNISYTVVNITVRLLPPFNSICNPIIYACLDEKYREAFKRLYKRMKCQ